MKGTAIALTLILALLILAGTELQLAKLAKANPIAFMPHSRVASPENTTYTTNSIPVDITVEVSQRFYYNDSSFFYNGSPWINIHLDEVSLKVPAEVQTSNGSWLTFHGETIINDISDGPHKLSVDYFSATIASLNNPVVYFIVETHAPTMAESSSIPKPSVPEFTVKLVEGPSDIPSSYWISPFTGRNITIPGIHIAKRAIVVTIKNQPFTSYYDANSGWNITFYYNVRAKLHSEENWTVQYGVEDVPARTDSEHTNLVYPMYDENANAYQIAIAGLVNGFPPDAQVDFQVEAMIGYVHRVWNPNYTSQLDMYPYVFTGEESGWSNTQTVTISGDIPNLAILNLQNTTFSSSNVPLIFSVDKPVSLVKYSLDGQANVTVAGNTTLTGLANGYHNVTVYATDQAGNTGASETLFFNVEVPAPLPIVPVAVSVAVAAVVALVTLVYWKKRKR